jgi:hypothetical protein
MKHFAYYPQIEYSNQLVTNITVRGKIRDAILKQSALYYKYTVADGERPDVISSKYYGNSSYVWAIFYANNIFDPNFQWPLDSNIFNKYITQKYGSVEKAKNTTDEFCYYLLDNKYYIDAASFRDPKFPEQTDTEQQNYARKTKQSQYDYELQLNNKRREIVVLDVSYLMQITNELKRLFQE